MARIDDFRAQLTGGGARPSLFRVILMFPQTLPIPGATEASKKAEFLVRATSLPASRINTIEIPFRGRTTKLAGDRVFDNWGCTIMNDTDFAIRNALESWSALIANHTSTVGVLTSAAYQTDMYVQQLDRNDRALKTYKFVNCFPVNISEIQLDAGASGQIEEFSVEFALDYWSAVDSTDVNQTGNILSVGRAIAGI